MERLLSDLILVVLRKLAVLDALALLQSTCALAPLYRVAAENPSVWKDAFCHGFSTNLRGCLQSDQYPSEVFAKMDEEVEALGGYRLLLIARFQYEARKRNSSKQNEGAGNDVLSQ